MKGKYLYISLVLVLLATTSKAYDSLKIGKSCSTNDDCPDLSSCQGNGGAKTCVHKDLFPITAREVFGTFFILILNAMLTAGGVGAGAAFVPYIILLFNYTLFQAIPVGYIAVFGGGLGNLINTILIRDPKTNRYLINYDVNMIILPALMIGLTIGLILNRIFPAVLINLILMLTLIATLYFNSKKLRANLAKEKAAKEEKKRLQEANAQAGNIEMVAKIQIDTETDKTLVTRENDSEKELSPKDLKNVDNNMIKPDRFSNLSAATVVPETKTQTQAVNVVVLAEQVPAEAQVKDPNAEKQEKWNKSMQKYPWRKLAEMSINVLIIILVGFLRGTNHFQPITNVDWTCWYDFIWFAVSICLYGICLIRNVYLVHNWQAQKKACGYEFRPEEPFLTRYSYGKLIVMGVFAGIIGAIVALGGSLIMGPVLLSLGMPPQFSAASTGLFMIFSMFNAMLQSVLMEKLTGQQIAWFLCLALAFSFISSRIVNWYVRRTGKQSTIIMLIMTVSGMGLICLFYILIDGLVEDLQGQTTFTSVCY